MVSKAGEWTGESATARRSFEDSLSPGQSWQACPPAPFEAAPGSESISGGGGSGCAPAGTAGGPAPGPGPRPCNRDRPGSGPLPPHWLFSIRAPASQPPPGARSRGLRRGGSWVSRQVFLLSSTGCSLGLRLHLVSCRVLSSTLPSSPPMAHQKCPGADLAPSLWDPADRGLGSDLGQRNACL